MSDGKVGRSSRSPLAELRENAAAAVRCLILLTVFGLAKYLERADDNLALDCFLAGASGYVLFTTFVLPRLVRRGESALTQLALDVLLITGLIYVQGGIRSEYYLLYYLPIMHASVRLNFRDAIGASALSALCYLLIGLIQGPESQVISSAFTRTAAFAASAGLLSVFFTVLAKENRNYQRLTQWYQQASEAKSQFMSTVSHELRTPLTAIIGFSEILKENDLEPDKAKEYVGIVAVEAQRLAKLIEDLSSLSHIEEGRFKLKPGRVEIKEVIQESLLAFTEDSRGHQFEVTAPEGLPAAWADRDRVIQIVTNLVSNAIKYSDPDTKISISAAARAGGPGGKPQLIVEVTDRGPGIEPEDLPKLFERFYRTANSAGKARGTGLGLAVVKALVECQGGQVTVKSNVGQGSTFSFSLPALAEAHSAQGTADRAAAAGELSADSSQLAAVGG